MMSKVLCLGVGIAALALAMVTGPASGQKADNKEVEFMKEAAMGGLAEVKLGQLAMENATNEQVKDFGKRMANDHSQGNKQLAQLASSRNVSLPNQLDKQHQALFDKFARIKGNEFDKEYMRHMVEDHEKDIGKFNEASKFVQDAELKTWIGQQLKVMNEHLRMAKDIHSKVEKASK